MIEKIEAIRSLVGGTITQKYNGEIIYQEWKDYCVALRDLPANYSPTIDIIMEDNYPLVKEDNTTPWPEEPSDG